MPPPCSVREYVSFGRSLSLRTWSNHERAAVSATSVPPPVSCPPVRQSTDTGVPCAAMPRALASASLKGKSESCSPWVSRVGAAMRFNTLTGLDCCSKVSNAGSTLWPWASF